MSEAIHGSLFGISSQPNSDPFNIVERTDLAVATLDSISLVGDRGFARERVSKYMQDLHSKLSVNCPEVGVEPFVTIDFGLVTKDGLLKAFDARQKRPTSVTKQLWDQYTSAELNSRRIGQIGRVDTSLPLVGGHHARAMVLGGSSTEAGLHFTNKTFREQVNAVGTMEVINLADYIMLMAQRREAGEQPLDTETFTRFPQLRAQFMDGRLEVPDALSNDGVLELDGSNGDAYPDDGVRLSLS